ALIHRIRSIRQKYDGMPIHIPIRESSLARRWSRRGSWNCREQYTSRRFDEQAADNPRDYRRKRATILKCPQDIRQFRARDRKEASRLPFEPPSLERIPALCEEGSRRLQSRRSRFQSNVWRQSQTGLDARRKVRRKRPRRRERFSLRRE